MKFLVTGVKGQLGFDCVRELQRRHYSEILGIDVEDLDITQEDKVAAFVAAYHPDVIFHNAAWTAVDKAEKNEEAAYAVNALGTKYLSEAAAKIGAKIIYISTDYVFPGTGEEPYETDTPVNPVSVYGRTKLAGEIFVRQTNPHHFIVRTSWVFGKNGNNFVKTIRSLAQNRPSINVVSDQIGSPTFTRDLARLLVDMAETEKYGTYHATNEGFCSWADFASEIVKMENLSAKICPVTTEEYLRLVPNQASRPKNSRLSKQKLIDSGFVPLPSWKDALRRYLEEIDL